MEILRNPNYDFLGKTKIFLTLSLTLVLAGLAYIAVFGLHYGVEFSGGTQMIVKFQQRPEVDKVRDAVGRVADGAIVQSFGEVDQHQMLIRLAGGEAQPQGEQLSGPAQAVIKSLAENYGANPVLESSSEIVGPVV